VRKKRSWMFIAAGTICAVLAVLIVKKQISPRQSPDSAVKGIDMLLASRDIQYGEALVLKDHGNDPNVILVSGWPSDLKPVGAFTKATDITEHLRRASASFVKHEVIIEAKTIPDADFVPPDMKVERVGVDKDDIRSGRVRPGMLVDVLQIVNGQPRSFMRNVRVYAVGSLDARGRPVRKDNPPPVAYLLVKSEDYLTFLKARLNTKFMLIEATDPSGGGPLLVAASVRQEAQRKEIQADLDDAAALMATGDYEKALPVLRRAAGLYPEITDLSSQATKQIAACREQLATRRYDQAEHAVDQGDYAGALLVLDTINKEFSDVQSVVKKAAALRQRADDARQKNLSQVRYEAAVKELEDCLAGGDLPRASQLVAELKQLQDEGFKPQDETQDLAAIVADYDKKVRDTGQAYDNDRMILESFLRQGNVAAARTKLEQIKEKFPRHPDLAELAAKVPAENANP
jgi:Flp pilus assembly protein CpaB